MIITKEITSADEVRDLVWSGGRDWVNDLTDDQIETILQNLEEIYPDGMSDTELNDFFWFEPETYAEWLGFRSADDLLSGKDSDYYEMDKWVRIVRSENPQFDAEDSIIDNIDSILGDDYEFEDDSEETYDDTTDTWGGYIDVQISQAGIDDLNDAGVTFEEIER